MVRFEFTLDDTDASNLISILHDEQVRALDKAQDFCKPSMTRADQANYNWYTAHATYLEALKQKVISGNTSVL